MPVEEERRKNKKEEKMKEDEQNQNFQVWFFKIVKGWWKFWSSYSIRIVKGSSL